MAVVNKRPCFFWLQTLPKKTGSHWNWAPALSALGFQRIFDSQFFEQNETINLGLSDGSFFKQIVPMVLQQKQPFYDYFVTLTSHGPFDLPKQHRKLSLETSLDSSVLGGYFQSIHYTDEQIGNFLDQLDKSGILDHTVIVIYGDHAGVHKYYNDEVKKVEPRENWWLDESQRVPLLIYHKGMQGAKVMTAGGEIDILPTVAGLMGVEENKFAYTAMGRNLLNTTKDFAVLADKTFVGIPSKDQREKRHAIEGIDIADLIIRSNYFKAGAAKAASP